MNLFSGQSHTLRPYQEHAVAEAIRLLDKNPCIVAPTGSGKTTIATELVRRLAVPTLWLAHRRELIGQAAERLRSSGLNVGIVLAGEVRTHAPVQVASVQTLIRRQLPQAQVIIIDEAQHTPGSSFRRIIDSYPNARRVGLTATPFRLDGQGLGDTFGELVVAAWPDELCKDGTLIEPRVYAPPAADFSSIRVRMGDYDKAALAKAIDRPKLVGDVVETWIKNAAGRKTVLFAVNVNHSRHIIDAFKASGIAAEHIDGATPKDERRNALARLATGKLVVLSNCMVLTEGWDLPSLECAIIARPTASLCLHLQMIGRIMRACDGKAGAIVLDHAGNFHRHGRVTQRLEYSLSGSVRQSSASGGTGLRTCPKCYRMVLSSRSQCPECGFVFATAIELPETEAGELVEVTGIAVAARQEQMQAYWTLLMSQLGQRKFAWAKYTFRSRFGVFPDLTRLETPEHIRVAAFDQWQRQGQEQGRKPGYPYAMYRSMFGEYPRFTRKVTSVA